MESLEEIRAMVDAKRYVLGLQEVLDNYRGNLSRLLVDHDTMAIDPTLTAERRAVSHKQTEGLMQTTAARIRILEAKIESVNSAPEPEPEPNREARRRAAKAK